MRKFIIFLLCVPQFLMAQSVSLEDCQRWARENYPLIQRYELLEQSKQFTLSNIAKGWLPQVTFNAQATYQSDVVALPDALENMMKQYGKDVLGIKKDQYKLALDVQQTLYDGGTMSAQKKVTEAQNVTEKAQNDVELYALRERVNQLYFSLLLIDERMALNEEMQTVLQANEDKLSSLLARGVATESDRNAVRAERLTAKQQHTQLEGQREAVETVLSLFCGKEIKAVEKPSDVNSAVNVNTSQRPELALFDSQLAVTQQQEKALDSRILPKLSLFAQGYYGYPGMNMYEDMFSHKWSLNGLIGARLTWNISGLYTRKNDRSRLENQRQQIENQRDTFLFNQKMQSSQEGTAIANYRRVMKEDDEIIALRQNVRLAMESKLTHGVVDVTALIREITNENQAKINKSCHEIELLEHIYKLKHIVNQ